MILTVLFVSSLNLSMLLVIHRRFEKFGIQRSSFDGMVGWESSRNTSIDSSAWGGKIESSLKSTNLGVCCWRASEIPATSPTRMGEMNEPTRAVSCNSKQHRYFLQQESRHASPYGKKNRHWAVLCYTYKSAVLSVRSSQMNVDARLLKNVDFPATIPWYSWLMTLPWMVKKTR